MSLPEALERAATALPADADSIRPANGDPHQLLATLDAAAAVRVLTWMLANELEAGEELVAGWCEDDRGIQPLQEIDERSVPKVGRKLLRKALHRLRTSGVEIAAPKAADPVVSRLSAVADEITGAYMAPVDPRGAYLVFLVEAHPSGGARLFQVLLDEIRGIVEFDVYVTNRSKVRGFVRKLTESKSTGAVEIDAGMARGLIRRISQLHPVDRPLPRSFSEWRRKLEEGASESSPRDCLVEDAGADWVARIESQDDSIAAWDRAAGRVRDSTLGPWPPSQAEVQLVSEKLDTAIDAVLELDGEARTTALEAALAEATLGLFAGDHGSRTASRLEVSAYVAWKAERPDEAKDLMAAASIFRARQTDRNPVARAMLEICVASALKRVEEDSPEVGDDATPKSGS